MTNGPTGKPVLVCGTQPVEMEGMRWLLDNSGDLRCAGTITTLEVASELIAMLNPAAVIVDKSFGTPTLMSWLQRTSSTPTAPVLWGGGITKAEALRFMEAGARGIVRRTSPPDRMIGCLRAVTNGSTWMDDGIFEDDGKPQTQAGHSRLTPREQQITELVERGLKNSDIGRRLGIQTGTVKIHLQHIFEKTGARGRYGLALTGLREKGTLGVNSGGHHGG